MLAAHKSTLSTYSLSTLLFASAAMAAPVTALPLWDAPKIVPKQSPVPLTEPSTFFELAETNIGIAEPIGTAKFVAPRVRALRTLHSYHPDNPRGDSSIRTNPNHIQIAEQIISSLPAGIPIPWINRNDDGEVGLYWDDDDAYADIDIDSEGSVSFYSKLRSSGEEHFLSDIDPGEFTPAWAYRNLALLLPKIQELAA